MAVLCILFYPKIIPSLGGYINDLESKMIKELGTWKKSFWNS